MNAETLDGIGDGWADVALSRWGLMYLDSPIDALVALRRKLIPGGLVVVAVWAEEHRVSYVSVPVRALSKHVSLEQLDRDHPGACYYGEVGRLEGDLGRAGIEVEHCEEVEVPVMEAETAEDLVEWVLAFGRSSAIQSLSLEKQVEWKQDLLSAAEPYRSGEVVRLGGVTRVVVARSPE
jgi:hypothetical protein